MKMTHFCENIHGWFTFPLFYQQLVNESKNGYHFVEVGTWKGKSATYMAVEIINSNKQIKFDCVDTWRGSEEHIDKSSPFYEPLLEKEDGLYNHFLENIKTVNHVINPIRLNSIDAALLYPDQSLNCVFLDAAHDYDNVCADIKSWLPKIKPGGILAGHDIMHEPIQRATSELLGYDVITLASQDVWIFKNKK
jgi:hypothetical protein